MSYSDKKMTVNKQRVIEDVSLKTGLNEELVREVMYSILDSLFESLLVGNRVEFRGFGVFERVKRKQKVGRNPNDPTVSIIIPSTYTVTFRESKRFKESLSNQMKSG